MAAKRRLVKRPKQKTEWTLQHADRAAEVGWADLIATQRGPCRTLFDRLEHDPTATDNIDKQHPLKGTLATATIGGRTFPQWQYELAGGARVWYAIDESTRTVYLTRCATSHPNETK